MTIEIPVQASGETSKVGAPASGGSSDEALGSDRRRFQRIDLVLNVVLRFPSVAAAVRSETVDLSEGGMFIRMANPRPEGTPIRIQLELGLQRVEIGGIVVRAVRPGGDEPSGIAVLFTDLREQDNDFVQALIRGSSDSH